MSITVKLRGAGRMRALNLDDLGRLEVAESYIPPVLDHDPVRIFRQFLTTSGLPNGTKDMRVNGSVNPVDFFVPAVADYDRYICSASFVIADAGATLNNFGAIALLTNGCNFFYQNETGEITIHDALKGNFDFMRLSLGVPPVGSGNDAFLANNIFGTSEAYLPVIDFRETFGLHWGIRLRANTNQRLVLRVRDLTTAIDQFDCIAYGFERIVS